MKPTLYVMRGFMGSGKTTYANKLRESTPNTMVVSLDTFREMLVGSRVIWQENYARKNTEQVVKVAHDLTSSLLKSGVNVIFDAQNVRPRSVQTLVSIAQKAGAEVKTVDCKETLATLLQCNDLRCTDEQIDPNIIKRTYTRFNDTAFRPLDEVTEDNLLNKMIENANVRVKKVDGFDNLYSCNFTRDAFYNKKWDKYTSTARGLFLDGHGKVKCRGYAKFFNIGENEETKQDVVACKFMYPVEVRTKENGFLGLISSIDGKLQFFSKGGKTDYSALVEKAFYNAFKTSYDGLITTPESVRELLESLNVTMACEVVDIENDKHIVPYEKSCIYILDFIKNTEQLTFASTEYDVFCSMVQYEGIGFKMPKYVTWLQDADEFNTFVAKHSDDINEGYVLRDRVNYMVKIKTNTYKRVKALRTALGNIISGKTTADNYKNKPIYEDLMKVLGQIGNLNDLLYKGDILNTDKIDMYRIYNILEGE